MNLVIHPKDSSTVFLKPIYENISEKTVLEKDISPKNLCELVKKSERVIGMGHGSPNGLFSVDMFLGWDRLSFFAIGDEHAEFLREKDQNIYIWCHADQFVIRHDLKGFYSGMFISEVEEAVYCGLKNVVKKMVSESNRVFSEVVGEHINCPKEELYDKVREAYGQLAKSNSVALYNWERLCVR